MKHIVLTEVDAKTKVPCTVEPQRTGPSMPKIKGLVLDWADKSTWPVELGTNMGDLPSCAQVLRYL
jgi:hypothetical protein